MNKTQLIVLWIGIAVILIIGLSSPLNSSRGRVIFGETGAERLAFITKDIGQLFMRWTMTAIVTAGLIITLKKPDKVWQGLTNFWKLVDKETDYKPKDQQKQ